MPMRSSWILALSLAGLAAGIIMVVCAGWFRGGDPRREEVLLSEALEAGNRGAVERLAHAWRARGQADEAVIALARLAMVEGNAAEALGLLGGRKMTGQSQARMAVVAGDALLLLRRVGEAFQAYQSALSLSPDMGPAHLGLAACLLELGSLEQASVQALAASARDDTDGRPWHIEATVRHQLGDGNEAAQAAEKALARKLPRSSRIEILALLAQWHLESGRVPEARHMVESRAILAPEGPRQQGLEGWLAEISGNGAKGIPQMREALKAAPSDPEIAQWLAEALARAEDWQGVLEAASLARKLSPDRPTNYHLQAMALDRLGKPAEAVKIRERQEKVTRLLATMTDLAGKADADPANAAIREEMARVSEQLERPDWARAWRETSRASSLLGSPTP